MSSAFRSHSASTALAKEYRDYPAIRVMGSLLTADMIGRIGSGDPQLKGLRSEDYGLLPGRRLGEAASRRWEELLGAYQAFEKRRKAAKPTDSLVSLTRERWLLPLFDALGYGRLQYQRGGLTAEGRSFPVSHVWNNVPIHLPPWGRDLDARIGPGEDQRAPQSMLQDFLNTSDDHLWGIVSNGRKLRILRDAASLADAAFIEFDLETIFEDELYADFVLLFAIAHASRFETLAAESDSAEDTGEVTLPAEPSVADCWLEKWRIEGDRSGVRFREKLRDGLKTALEELGTGFLEVNAGLRQMLASGEISRTDFRDELLRLAYQVLFLFVAEDKGALLDPEADGSTKARYREFFSTERLRRLAMDRYGDSHDDLWRTLRIVLDALGADEGLPELGLPPLGGLYFRTGALDTNGVDADTNGKGRVNGRPAEPLRQPGVALSNQRLLAAIRHLTQFRDDHGRWQRVDYQHLDAEELGSVYESLLELIPYPDSAEQTFELKAAAGNDRKTTGSYYTPTALVETLLDSALDPVIEEYAKSGIPDDLLKITVCDPACGSGHFLVAAARRIARAYAVMEAGDEEPTPDAIEKAMPAVVRNCIYGVDLNPLAVELTKVSLWLASLEPGKPLAFLDPHIKVGNALIGTTPKLLDEGIPDGAFKPLEGDDKKFAKQLKKQNKKEAQTGQASLFEAGTGFPSNIKLAEKARRIDEGTKPGLAGIREQARRLRELNNSEEKRERQLAADAWCAAFVWPLRPDAPAAITNATMWQLRDKTGGLSPGQLSRLEVLSRRYHFFHWHLEFPEIFPGMDDEHEDYNPETGWQGGFTCIMGNPPWEQVKLQEKEFFASRDPEIARAPNKAKRDALIKKLEDSETGREVLREFSYAKRRSDGGALFLRESGLYPLNGVGSVNTYSVFTENGNRLLHPLGRLGMIVPTGIVTDATTQHFFKEIVQQRSLSAVYDFENRTTFPEVHSSYKFSLLTLTGRKIISERAEFAFYLHTTSEINDANKRFTLSAEEIRKLNPNSGTCPVFRSRRDADLALKIHTNNPVLIDHTQEDGNPWDMKIFRMLHMSDDAHLFHDREELESNGWRLSGNVFIRGKDRMLPLYEAKIVGMYDHRAADIIKSENATSRKGQPSYINDNDHKDPHRFPIPLSWVPASETEEYNTGWLSGYCNITSTTNERTVLASFIPKTPTGDTFQFFDCKLRHLLVPIFNSFALDYSARQKLSGLHLTHTLIKQFPSPTPSQILDESKWDPGATYADWITPRILELSYTAWDMEAFSRDMNDSGPPFVWNEERRFLIRCELDAAFFHLYRLDRSDVDYIMETFTIVKKKDLKAHSSFRTKDTILEIYDAMAKASKTGDPYRTILTPPPGEGSRHPERD
ncbi:Eco57I restriction-modification methylase domain-containing protein [Nocardiopsis rhodophaea]|uniref:Eco57I restriction-modification methylase domain-containing protein n=1 Tax=Nocardiopsis rhodophaea TaxID=280238 RepID=UPI0031DA969D